MTEEYNQPTWFSGDDPRGKLADLVARRDQLVQALRETEDPEQRAEFAFQLRAVSEHIETLTAKAPVDQPNPDGWPGAVTADVPNQGRGGEPPQVELSDLVASDWPANERPASEHPDMSWPTAEQRAIDPTATDTDMDWPPTEQQPIDPAPADDRQTGDQSMDWSADEQSAAEHPDVNRHDERSPLDETVGDEVNLNWPAPEPLPTGHPETGSESGEHSQFEQPRIERPEANWADNEPQDQLYTGWNRDAEDAPDPRPGDGNQPEDNAAQSDQPMDPAAYGRPVAEPIGLDPHQEDRAADDQAGFSDETDHQPEPQHGRQLGHRAPDPALFETTTFEAADMSGADAGQLPAEGRHHQAPAEDRPYAMDQTPAQDRPYAMDPGTGDQRQRGPQQRQPLDTDRNARRPRRAGSEPAQTPLSASTTGPATQGGFNRPSGPVLAVVGISLALLAGVLWFGDSGRSNDSATESIDPAAPQAAPVGADAEATVANIRAVLQGLGLPGVVVTLRDGVIHIVGPVPTQADHDAVTNAVQMVAETYPIDTSALIVVPGDALEVADAPSQQSGDRAQALQKELNRILGSTPLIFGTGQSALSELHQRILNNAVISLMGYPGFSLTIAGYTDDLGDNTTNEGLSLIRAENVRDYLVSQGLPAEAFRVEARGEESASGAAGLAGLERRVELEVNGAGGTGGEQDTTRVAIVAPSASNDLAFTQSMVDAVNIIASERSVELAVTDNTFVPDDAAAAVRGYAEQGFDLVIAHGSQFGSALLEIAPQYPNTAFAWGTASDTFGLPNVYAYDAAAQEGGYVLGALAGLLSTSNVVGVVGPIEVGDAAQYVNGFQAGALAENPAADVRVTYTGSFSDIGLASEAAQAQLDGGADVMTGSAQMVVGAIAAAEQRGALWFGTQSDQASLAPGVVVASQVYHWEVALRPIIDDLEAGNLAGSSHTANLANGGLVIEYNPNYDLGPELRQRADQLAASIAAGSITPPR